MNGWESWQQVYGGSIVFKLFSLLDGLINNRKQVRHRDAHLNHNTWYRSLRNLRLAWVP